MQEKRTILILLLTILFFAGATLYIFDQIGVLSLEKYLPFLKQKNPLVIEDNEYPTEVEKMEFAKWQEQLLGKEEELENRRADLASKEAELGAKLAEIEELKKGIQAEREKLAVFSSDLMDRQKKVKDLAGKVTNMPPDKAAEMMVNWKDFDVIDVLRQIDENALREGAPSLTPYLLTLFTPERRAEITRKMLLPPVEAEIAEPGAP